MKKNLITAAALLALASFTACSDKHEEPISIQAVTTTVEPVFVEQKPPASGETISVTGFSEQAEASEKTIQTDEQVQFSSSEDIIPYEEDEIISMGSEDDAGDGSADEYNVETANVTASASERSEENHLYIKTAAVPESAYEYAQKMFSSFTKSDLSYMGFTSDEIRSAVLAEGFCMRSLSRDAYIEDIFYFPVLCDGNFTAMMTVTYNDDGNYGFNFGKDDSAAAMNDLTTSYDNAAEIYVSSAVYGVTDESVTVLSYGIPYSESAVKEEIAYLESIRKESVPRTDIIIVAY